MVGIDVDPNDPEVDGLLADFGVHFAAFNELGRHPEDPAVFDAAMATVTGTMEDRVRRTLELLDERNQVSIPNPAVPTRVIVIAESITLIDDGAGFDACLISGETLVQRDDPNPTSTEPTSRSVTYGLSRGDGVWRVGSFQSFTVFEGQVGCE